VAYEKRKLFQTRLYQDIISHALTVSVFVFFDEFQMRRLIWFAEMKKHVDQTNKHVKNKTSCCKKIVSHLADIPSDPNLIPIGATIGGHDTRNV
jgi:hypothetical protein